MVRFSTVIKKFNDKGEKTGWTYIEIPAAVAEKLKPNNKKTFRVKGKLDNFSFKSFALLPMGDSTFIMALNAAVRKQIRKHKGASLQVTLEADNNPVPLNTELMECLADEPGSLSFFNSLTPGHRKYFSNWIDSAKTDVTKTKRIAQTLDALANQMQFGEMLRSLANKR